MKKISIYVLFIITLFIWKPNFLTAQVNVQDSLALVALYNGTDGPHWKTHDNWLTTIPVSKWYGITLTTNRVWKINLEKNSLSGSIPSQLSNLTNLNSLNLSNNHLSGNIPPELGNLIHLIQLDLSSNNLTGNIPFELGNLINPIQLNLSDNQLSGAIPVTLLNLNSKNLGYGKRLRLNDNKFTFAGMGRIARKFRLANYSPQDTIPLYKNDDTLSVAVGNIPYHNTYNWYKNGVLVKTKVGDSTFHPKTTGAYYVTVTNSIAINLTLQSDVAYYTSANDSALQVNVQDSLALVALYNSTNGPYWYLHTNWLTTVPVSFWYGIVVTENRVSEINLGSNQLSGNIPPEIGNLTHLKILNLNNNQLRDTIPGSLVNLRKLRSLNLASNNFTFAGMGRIARAFSNAIYSPQAIIPLHKNQGVFSVSVGSVPFNNTYNWYKDGILVKTNVGDSTFHPKTSGAYYVKVTNSVATQLTLQSNTVAHGDSTHINVQDSLALVDLYNSTGGHNWKEHDGWLTKNPVSKWHGVFVVGYRVSQIRLFGNNLIGNLPSSLGNLDSITFLGLSNNQLSGTIPPGLGNLTNLLYLYLDHNQLSTIPPELGNLTNLLYLYLDYNQLSDTIPSSLINLKKLDALNLEHNKFTFASMEKMASAFSFALYSPQANIPLNINGNILSVSAGGVLAHNTYKWYKDGVLFITNVGDSTFMPTESGAYYVAVNNSVATELTLYSNTINYSVGNNLIASRLRNKISAISIYPNPAKTNAKLSFNANGKYSITITDVSGKILQTKTGIVIKGSNIVRLDVSNYASGLYLVTITDEKNRKQTVRLSKE